MKILSADRSGWPRLLRRRFYLAFLEESGFCGYVSLICMDQVRAPLVRPYKDQLVCLAGDGYSWLQHFPSGEHFSITTMFDPDGQIIQWYIDVCRTQGVDERGIPWLEDLYLDIVVQPSGEVELMDREELDLALQRQEITSTDYALALNEAGRLLSDISQKKLGILGLSNAHRALLLRSTPL